MSSGTRKRPEAIAGTAEAIFVGDLDHIRRRSDRVFAWLMAAQWIFAITIAIVYSPYGWEGKVRSTHIHVQAAILLGTLLSAPVILLALKRPGWVVTRQVATISQMFWSALLIHLTGGRIETHFHVFGSLAFVAFYRDWKVLLTATVIVAGDHLVRGLWWPESVYGIPNPEWWRFLEHAFWVIFEDVVLVMGLRISLKEMRSLAERQAALKTTAANYQLVAHSASDGIITIDANDRVIFANPAAAQMFGYGEDELTGRAVQTIIVDSHTIVPDAAGEQRVVELRGVRKDGSEIPLEVSLGSLSLDGGAKCTAFLRDITERKKVDRLKVELLSTVSHELRTPLTSLRGFVELLLNREYSPARQRELLSIVHKETIRLTNLINDFLDIQRIESGRQVYAVACVDLRALVNDTVAVFTSEGAPHQLVRQIPPDLPFVMADVDRVRQVLSNLVSNAVKFSPSGGEIVIEASASAEDVTVSVTDHGIGIPPEAMPNLFTKFFRVDNRETRSVGGSGLGLALVKDIVEAQRGRIWVQSTLGKGSRFSFCLPRAQDTDASARATSPAEHSDRTDVLIVEDDEAYAHLLDEHLRDAGCEAITTAYGEEALDYVRKHRPRVIVLDVHLRGSLDGWDVLLALQAEAALREIPVILTTLSDRRVNGLALDGVRLVRRPADPTAWSDSLRDVLRECSGTRILVVDPDPASRESTVSLLRALSPGEVASAATIDEAMSVAKRWQPELALVDLDGQGMNGRELLSRLRAERCGLRLSVVAVTAREPDAPTITFLARKMARLVHKNSMGAGTRLEVVEQALGLLPARVVL
jgi:PAS domain S-box-containing protein